MRVPHAIMQLTERPNRSANSPVAPTPNRTSVTDSTMPLAALPTGITDYGTSAADSTMPLAALPTGITDYGMPLPMRRTRRAAPHGHAADPHTRVSPSGQVADGLHESVLTAQFAPFAQCTTHDLAPEQLTAQSAAHVISQAAALSHATVEFAPTESEQSTAAAQLRPASVPVDPLQVAPSVQLTFDPAPTPR
jgi:hypothetical protein